MILCLFNFFPCFHAILERWCQSSQEVGSCIVCLSWLEETLVLTYKYTCTILIIKIIAFCRRGWLRSIKIQILIVYKLQHKIFNKCNPNVGCVSSLMLVVWVVNKYVGVLCNFGNSSQLLFNKGWECIKQYRGLTYIGEVAPIKRAPLIVSL